MEVGSKVVCVIAGSWTLTDGAGNGWPLPKKGDILTIAGIILDDPDFVSRAGYSFVECNPKDYFCSRCFRPVDESFGEEVAEKLEVFFVPLEAAYKEQNFGE